MLFNINYLFLNLNHNQLMNISIALMTDDSIKVTILCKRCHITFCTFKKCSNCSKFVHVQTVQFSLHFLP